MRQISAVVEFGTSTIVCLISESNRFDDCYVLGSSVVEYAGFKNNHWVDSRNVGKAVLKAVQEAEKQAGHRVRKLHIGIPADFTQTVCSRAVLEFKQLKRVTSADIDALYRKGEVGIGDRNFAVIHRCPVFFTLDRARRTMDPVDSEAMSVSAVISYVLADKSFFGGIIQFLRQHGYEESTLISASYAQVMSYIPEESRDRGAILVDIGHLSTAIVVARGDGILFHRVVPVGGANITNDLETLLGVKTDIATQLKFRSIYGLALDKDDFYEVADTENTKFIRFPAISVQEIIEARLEEIVDIIDFVLSESRCRLPEYAMVYLTGGTASLRGIREFTQKRLGRNVSLILPKATRLNKPCYSSALAVMNMALDAETEEEKSFFDSIKSLFGK